MRHIFEKCREKIQNVKNSMKQQWITWLTKILKSVREMIREELPGLIKSAIGEEVKKLLGMVNELSEENNRLKAQLRANNLIIYGLPDASLAEANGGSRRDTFQAVINCCNSKA